jgi:hypothetical protein
VAREPGAGRAAALPGTGAGSAAETGAALLFLTPLAADEFPPAAALPLPRPLARRVAALVAEGGDFLAAVNGQGMARIVFAAGGGSFRVEEEAIPGAGDLSVASLWPLAGGGSLLQLYRDPFTHRNRAAADLAAASGGIAAGEAFTAGTSLGAAAAADPAGAARDRLLFLLQPGTNARPLVVRALEGGLGEGGPTGLSLFSLWPAPAAPGSWLAQLRGESEGRAISRWLRLASLEPDASSRELGRAAFEEALAPRLLSLAGTELRAAAESLASGDILLRERGSAGGEAWWRRGDLAKAVELCAWSDGEAVAVLSPDGQGLFSQAGVLTSFRLESPRGDALFTGIAFVRRGGSRILAASWDAGPLPEVDASGLVLLRLP